MKLQLCLSKAVAKVSPLVGAAVRARRDALSALGGAASPDQQLAVLDSVAAVFEKEGVSLAELGRSRGPIGRRAPTARLQFAQVGLVQVERAAQDKLRASFAAGTYTMAEYVAFKIRNLRQ